MKLDEIVRLNNIFRTAAIYLIKRSNEAHIVKDKTADKGHGNVKGTLASSAWLADVSLPVKKQLDMLC
ncbi:MAG: hypothetical protein IGNPGNKH_00137 [Sodalis sp. Ffu]|nr:MAG: hypothetical protein IGNPGNKH_00137 [Sodalis sp. Ffu]